MAETARPTSPRRLELPVGHPDGVFDRILCGLDPSEAGGEALRQARRLLAPGGELAVVTAYDTTLAVHGGWAAPRILAELAEEARRTIAEAEQELVDVPRRSLEAVDGDPVRVLFSYADRLPATLLAVGTHDRSRLAGIVLGTVASSMLHGAPCSVLVARPPRDPERFPRRIVAGVDGSEPSLAAARVAEELGERFGAEVVLLAAGEPPHVDATRLSSLTDVERDGRPPVEALVAAASVADLLVVGSRGLRGLSSLGSVSERVAHRAPCSVLVVRSSPG